MKPKLVAWCDFIIPTGFGNVAKHLMRDMHEHFEVDIVGINYRGKQKYDTSKYFVYPTSTMSRDYLGTDILKDVVQEQKPDVIFLFQDIFHISKVIEELRNISPKSKIVVYFPVDGGPMSMSWYNALIKSDKIFVYTEWSKDVIKDTYIVDKDLTTLYHGVDQDVFYPLEDNEIMDLKKDNGWEGKFVISNVNRFQPRKAITTSIRAYSMFAKGFRLCMDCNHHMPINRNRCELCRSTNLKDRKSDVDDTMLYLHMMPQEPSMGKGQANSLQNHLLNAGFKNEDIGKILSVNGANIYGGDVPESRVNEIYNMSNVNYTTSLGEGCGLSLIESAATGTPSIAPYNSAIPEMIEDTGWLCDNKAIISQANDNGFFRPLVDEWKVVQALKDAYKKWQKSSGEITKKQECIDLVNRKFQWDDKRELLLEGFKSLL